MIQWLGYAAAFGILGVAVTGLSLRLESPFLVKFIDGNLIAILIALLAINTTTLSVIMTKLREISGPKRGKFSNSIGQMRISVIEQVALIIIGIIVQIVKEMPSAAHHQTLQFFLVSALAGILFWSLYILYDTANGVFVLWDHESE